MLVISIVLSGIILLPFTGSFIKVFKSPTEAASLADLSRNPFYIILNAVVSALIYPAMPIFAFILYFNGRAMEEVHKKGMIVMSRMSGLRTFIQSLFRKMRMTDRKTPEKSIKQNI